MVSRYGCAWMRTTYTRFVFHTATQLYASILYPACSLFQFLFLHCMSMRMSAKIWSFSLSPSLSVSTFYKILLLQNINHIAKIRESINHKKCNNKGRRKASGHCVVTTIFIFAFFVIDTLSGENWVKWEKKTEKEEERKKQDSIDLPSALSA